MRLARQAAFAAEKKILGELLRDGRAAHEFGLFVQAGGLAAGRSLLRRSTHALVDLLVELFGARLRELVALPGLFQGVPFDAAVVREIGILRRDHGTFERVGDLLVPDPLLTPGDFMAFDS